MRTQSIRYAIVAVVGIAVGALATQWMRQPRESSATDRTGAGDTAGPAPSPEAPLPRRRGIVTRSANPTLEQLEALGYVDGTEDPRRDVSGVIVNETARTSPGYNFYTSRLQAGARLIDMGGREIHRWDTADEGGWQHAELLPDGDVIVIVRDGRLSRYDRNSNLVWSVEGRFHHDLWIHRDEIHVLARVGRMVEYVHPQRQILVDVIQVRSMDGDLKREISVLDAIHGSPYGFLLPSVAHRGFAKRDAGVQLDVLHTNHVEVFDGTLADRDPIYAEGNILLSFRNINAVAILDGRTSEVLWIWGPTNLTFPHHPTLIENGHILIFDNGLTRSRVVEVEPSSGRIVWLYAPRSGFFSKTRGSNQRLANGNTLITESDTGYVFEVTRDWQMVWRFANPNVTPQGLREAIWRMTRVEPDTLTFLER
jgi:hypothetical protein